MTFASDDSSYFSGLHVSFSEARKKLFWVLGLFRQGFGPGPQVLRARQGPGSQRPIVCFPAKAYTRFF